jgi:hypothetical protein
VETADYGDKAAAVPVALSGSSKTSVAIGGTVEDTLHNIENVTGGLSNDSLTGNGLANMPVWAPPAMTRWMELGADDTLKGKGPQRGAARALRY